MKWEPTTLDQVLADADCCKDHPIGIDPALLVGVIEVVARQEVADWDNESFAIAELADGRFLAVSEWEDSSGHG